MENKELKDLSDDLKNISNKSEKSMNELTEMIQNPEKYFEDHPIEETWQDPPKAPTLKEVEFIIKNGSTEQRTRLYAVLGKVCHFQKRASKTDENAKHFLSREFQDELEELISGAFRNKGWQIRGQKEMRDGSYRNIPDTMPHLDFDGICINEIPRYKGSNKSVTDYVFDSDGEPVTYEKFLENFRKDHPVEEKSFDELTEDLDETQKKMIEEFMQEENLTVDDISSIGESYIDSDIMMIDIYSRQYSIVESEEIAERIAFDMIDNDDEMEYFWRQKIEHDSYRGSFDDFVQLVKDDGWHYQLCRYDHEYKVTKSGFVYWRED